MSEHALESISLGWVFRGCANVASLRDPELHERLKEFLEEAEFTVYLHGGHIFPGEGGGSAVAIIGESSADYHAWPERGTLHVRLFYCQFSGNNDHKAKEFLRLCEEHFKPTEILHVERIVYPI